MRLGDYLSENNIPHADFAARIGVSQPAVTRYARHERTPKPEVMRKIREETNGAVTANDFFESGASA